MNLHNYEYIVNRPKYDILNDDIKINTDNLTRLQEQALRYIRNNKSALIISGRRTGKSYLGALYIIETLSKSCSTALYIVNNNRQIKSIVSIFRDILPSIKVTKILAGNRLEMSNGKQIDIISTSIFNDRKNVTRGKTYTSIVMDDIDFCKNMDEVYNEGIHPMVNSINSNVLLLGQHVPKCNDAESFINYLAYFKYNCENKYEN